jgi:hypothetical protein
VPADVAEDAWESVGGAVAVASTLSPVDGARLLDSAFAAICARLVLVAAVLTVFGLRAGR